MKKLVLTIAFAFIAMASYSQDMLKGVEEIKGAVEHSLFWLSESPETYHFSINPSQLYVLESVAVDCGFKRQEVKNPLETKIVYVYNKAVKLYWLHIPNMKGIQVFVEIK